MDRRVLPVNSEPASLQSLSTCQQAHDRRPSIGPVGLGLRVICHLPAAQDREGLEAVCQLASVIRSL